MGSATPERLPQGLSSNKVQLSWLVHRIHRRQIVDDYSLHLIIQEPNDIKANYQNELSDIILHLRRT